MKCCSDSLPSKEKMRRRWVGGVGGWLVGWMVGCR